MTELIMNAGVRFQEQKSGSTKMEKELKFQKLTEKYGLKYGAEISLKKINLDPSSDSKIKIGEELNGIVGREVSLGKGLILHRDNIFIGNTSGIVDIREVDDNLEILTESRSTYEVKVKNSEISIEDKFKKLTEKYQIGQGLEISIKKVEIGNKIKSSVKPGEVLEGVITQEIGIGKSLYLAREGKFVAKTSNIVNIREKNGRLQFLTQSDSVYEVIPKENENKKEIEKLINKYFDKQPERSKDILKKHQDLFISSKEIDNKKWFFTANIKGKVMALVNSDENPDVFYPRFFRISTSDHQFKAFPAFRDNDGVVAKGDEKDTMHHYVQSAKLDSRIMLALQELAIDNDANKAEILINYIPVVPISRLDNTVEKNLEDFKFSEEQVVFKNKEWQEIKEIERKLYFLYFHLNSNIDYDYVKNFHNSVSSGANYFGINGEKLNKALHEISNKNDKWTMADIRDSSDSNLKNYYSEISEMSQKITEAIFNSQRLEKKMMESGFVPNFKQKAIDKYIKTDGKSKINIEVFKNKSPEGDVLCWEIATDDKGRVYVDNIYDPSVGIDSYGTVKKKTNMGMLVYKPEDYIKQSLSIPEKYKKESGGVYVDISKLLEESIVIKKYKESKKFYN